MAFNISRWSNGIKRILLICYDMIHCRIASRLLSGSTVDPLDHVYASFILDECSQTIYIDIESKNNRMGSKVGPIKSLWSTFVSVVHFDSELCCSYVGAEYPHFPIT